MRCENAEELRKATAQLLRNDSNLEKIELKFGPGLVGVSVEEMAEFVWAMEICSITNLQLKICFTPCTDIKERLKHITRIVQCDCISDLTLRDQFSTDDFASITDALSQNSAIKKFRIGICPSDFGKSTVAAIVKLLCSKKISLESLDLGSNNMGDEGCRAIVKALRSYSRLKRLDVRNCGIGVEGAFAIGQLLQSGGRTIEELNISGNPIESQGCAAIMTGLLKYSSIRILGMNACGIWREGAKFIAINLSSERCAIEDLDLGGNWWIGDEGCVLIMEALRSNKSLCKLNLSECRISNEGMKGFLHVLENNDVCLRNLSLRSNHRIGAEGFIELAIALSRNSSLEELDLFGCNVGDKGCISLMSALSHNSSLKTINLEFCRIGDEGGKAIANFLKRNTGTIRDLSLERNNFYEESFVEIAKALLFNTHLTNLSCGNNVNLMQSKKVWIAFDDVAYRNYSLQNLDMADFYGEFKDYETSIQKNLDVNKKLGPVKAEMVKTGLFPHQILSCLTASFCFVEALSKVASLEHLSPVFHLVCEQPLLFNMDNCAVARGKGRKGRK